MAQQSVVSEGLLIAAGLALVAANAFDLTRIATLGSAGFLLIFTAANPAHARHASCTHSRSWISATGAVACLVALAAFDPADDGHCTHEVVGAGADGRIGNDDRERLRLAEPVAQLHRP